LWFYIYDFFDSSFPKYVPLIIEFHRQRNKLVTIEFLKTLFWFLCYRVQHGQLGESICWRHRKTKWNDKDASADAKKSDNFLHLPKEDTPTTGQSQNFHNITIDSDNSTNYYYDAGHGNLEAIIYEEEDCFLNSNYENRLTTEEFFFAASILDPTFSGICLPSAFPDSFDFEISMESNLPISNGPAIVHHYRLPPQGIIISSKTSANTSNRSLLHKFIFSNRVSVQIFNQYRVILWDPGIFSFL